MFRYQLPMKLLGFTEKRKKKLFLFFKLTEFFEIQEFDLKFRSRFSVFSRVLLGYRFPVFQLFQDPSGLEFWFSGFFVVPLWSIPSPGFPVFLASHQDSTRVPGLGFPVFLESQQGLTGVTGPDFPACLFFHEMVKFYKDIC